MTVNNGNMPFIFMKRTVVVILAYTLCVIAGPLNSEVMTRDFPGSYDQENLLADYVCSDLESDQLCLNFFLDVPENFTEESELPSEIKIINETKSAISFETISTSTLNLVVLINDEDPNEVVNYVLVKDNNSSASLAIPRWTPSNKYTFWTTLLSAEGSHSVWRKGPEVQPWDDHGQARIYYINHEFLYDAYMNGTYVIDAWFSWNDSAPLDPNIQVLNTCNKTTQGNSFWKSIQPHQNRSVIVGGLPLDDHCSFNVIGEYGNGTLVYHTPACRELPGCKPLPGAVRDIRTNTTEDGNEDQWMVNVKWAQAEGEYDHHNVTIYADKKQSIIVPGNSTEITFHNVTGEGFYEVSVNSSIGDHGAVTSKLAHFPARGRGSEDMIIGVAWFAAVLALVAIALMAAVILSWKRRQHDKTGGPYYEGLQNKPMKFGETDSVGSELIVEDQWEVRPERLLLHEVIGEGAFGVVRRGSLAPDGRHVAIKMLKDFPSVEEIRSFRAEMELMKSVGAHPHVVSLVGCCSGRRPLIVAEYCSRGDLLTYLRCAWDMMVAKRNAKYYNNNKENVDYRNDLFKTKELKEYPKMVVNRLYDLQGVCDTELTIPDLLSFCRQIAMGMEFLASNRVVHRDLAARNVLVTADRTLKIADFGLSRDVYQENQYRQKGNGKMPVKWMALESLTHRIYTTQSDVWSFGVVMWEVVTLGGAPYASLGGARLPRLLRAGYRMPRPNNCSPQLYEVMLSCWHSRPRSRPTFSELHARLDAQLAACAHPYLPLHLHEADDAPRTHRDATRAHRYVRMLFRGERPWARERSYERPAHNHYTARPTAVI